MNHPFVVGITGSSGVVYGQRLVEVMLQAGLEIHLVISHSGIQVIKHELEIDLDDQQINILDLVPDAQPDSGQIQFHRVMDFMSPIASGSYQTAGMVVCPCSGATMSSIAHGSSRNLIERAADVHLKERRPLVLVPRETPLSLIHLDNMRTASAAGATILPASPGFYHGISSIQEMVDFVVARVLDQLDIKHDLSARWGKA